MSLSEILFLDIETVPRHPDYNSLSDRSKELWNKKARFLIKSEEDSAESVYERAGIYAEFGKVISIACGNIEASGDTMSLRIVDFSGHDEKQLLSDFADFIKNRKNSSKLQLCAHNGKEFDFPYLARRMVINNLPLPDCLNLSGKKPWEVSHIDTMEMWKFGDYKHFTSLDLLANILDIPSSKSDIDGSQVYHVYYKEKGLPRITRYCKRDVAVLAQVYLRLTNHKPLKPKDIIYVQ